MPQNSFRNIGLRRDKNFSDLENRGTGLTNLLNDFPSGTDTYIGDDLNEAIKSIRSYPVTQLEINRFRLDCAYKYSTLLKNDKLDKEIELYDTIRLR